MGTSPLGHKVVEWGEQSITGEIEKKSLLTLFRVGPLAVSKVRGGADLPPLGF